MRKGYPAWSMAEPSWTQHIAVGATWRRFGWMLLFAPVLACTGLLVAFAALFQFFSMLASGEPNPQLTGFGRELSRLAAAIMDYLTYNTERRPFPFGHWPVPGPDHGPPPAPDNNAGAPRRRARSARRRSARKGGKGQEKQARPSDPSDAAVGIGGREAPPDDETA